MKRKILIPLLLATLFSSCGEETKECNHVDENKNHFCDICKARIDDHKDENKDHFCDYCSEQLSSHIDLDNDFICDYCGQEIPSPTPYAEWPEKEVQNLVLLVSGSEVLIPHYSKADDIEINDDDLETDGYFSIYCYIEESKSENEYKQILLNAGWKVESSKDKEGYFSAVDSKSLVNLTFGYFTDFTNLVINVSSTRQLKWPEKEIQDLVIVVSGSEVKIPHYDKADYFEVNTDYLVDEYYFGIYCYTEDSNSEDEYKQILLDAGWEVESQKDEMGYISAYDSNYEVWINFGYFEGFKDLEICVTCCYKTKWSGEYIAESLQLIAPGTKTKIPEFYAYTTIATFYPQYQILAINGYGYEDTVLEDYKTALTEDSWSISFNESSQEWNAISPNKDIEIHFYVDDSKGEFNVDVMSYIEPSEDWPYEEIAAVVKDMGATGEVPAYNGEYTSFTVDTDWFPPAIFIDCDASQRESGAEFYNQYIQALGYVYVGEMYGDPMYAKPGTTLAIRALVLMDVLQIELFKLDEPAK